MWCGFFGPTATFPRRADWPIGDRFREQTANLRAYIKFFHRGYPNVADGPIRATGWYALTLHEWERHPYGPFPSRIAASAWWKRWLDAPASWRRTWAWRTTPGSVRERDPRPRNKKRLRRIAPAFGLSAPKARQPRRPHFPRATKPYGLVWGWWPGAYGDTDPGVTKEQLRALGQNLPWEDSPTEEELIEELRHEMDLDACGVAPECRDECCPCYLLGRNGHPITIWGSGNRWGFSTHEAGRVVWSEPFGSLEEAVRACQRFLEEKQPIRSELLDDNLGTTDPSKARPPT